MSGLSWKLEFSSWSRSSGLLGLLHCLPCPEEDFFLRMQRICIFPYCSLLVANLPKSAQGLRRANRCPVLCHIPSPSQLWVLTYVTSVSFIPFKKTFSASALWPWSLNLRVEFTTVSEHVCDLPGPGSYSESSPYLCEDRAVIFICVFQCAWCDEP